jgi:TonB family protein
MRLPVALAVILCAVPVTAATFESRSQLYALTVQVEDKQYVVRVTDLRTNSTLVSREFTTLPADASTDVGDIHLEVHVRPSPHGISATAEVEQGEMLLDSLHAVWMLKPRRAHIRAPGAFHVGDDVRPPSVTRRVEPMYPVDARRDRISGIVILEVLVDKSGTVRDAVVLKDLPGGLGDSALAAVKQWVFQPATRNGEAVDVIFNLTVNFKLGEGSQ